MPSEQRTWDPIGDGMVPLAEYFEAFAQGSAPADCVKALMQDEPPVECLRDGRIYRAPTAPSRQASSAILASVVINARACGLTPEQWRARGPVKSNRLEMLRQWLQSQRREGNEIFRRCRSFLDDLEGWEEMAARNRLANAEDCRKRRAAGRPLERVEVLGEDCCDSHVALQDAAGYLADYLRSQIALLNLHRQEQAQEKLNREQLARIDEAVKRLEQGRPAGEEEAAAARPAPVCELTALQELLLLAARELGAQSFKTRRSRKELIKQAFPKNDPENYKKPLSRLVQLEHLRSSQGQNGGYWLP